MGYQVHAIGKAIRPDPVTRHAHDGFQYHSFDYGKVFININRVLVIGVTTDQPKIVVPISETLTICKIYKH